MSIIETSGSEPGKVKVSGTSININQIISTVRRLTEKTEASSIGGEHFNIRLDGFNFSVGKSSKNYKLIVSLDFGVSRKKKNF